MKKKMLMILTILISIVFLNNKVNASTFTEEVILKRDMTINIDNTSIWGPNEGVYFTKNIFSNDEISQTALNFTTETQNNIKRNDYIAFNFIITKPINYVDNQTVELGPNLCVGYSCSDLQGNVCRAWGCDATVNSSDYEAIVKEYNVTDLQINARVVYGGKYNNQWAACTISGTEIWCPTYKTEIKQLVINYWFKTDETRSFGIGIMRNAKQYDSQNIQGAIDNQTNTINNTLTQDHNYNKNESQSTQGQKQEIDNYEQEEDNLRKRLNLNIENAEISVNPNANNFIWEVVNKLRTMSGKIVLLFTSVLSLGIMKMILGR